MPEPAVPSPPPGEGTRPAEDRAADAGLDLDRFFDLAVDLLCVASMDGTLLRVSRSWQALLGYQVEELVGGKFLDLVHPDDVPATLDAVAQLERGATILNFVNRYRRRDGEFVWLEWRSSAPGGGVIYAVARDITERRRVENERRAAEEALRESERRYRLLFEQASEGIALADATTGVILDCNKAFERMTGYSREELIGMPQRQLHPPEIRSGPVTADFAHHAGEGAGQIVVGPVQTKSGEIRDFSVEADAVMLDGRRQVLGFFQDVTEFRRAAEQVRASERRFRTLVEHASEAIFVHVDRRFAYLNQAAVRLFGAQTAEELIGRSMLERVAPEAADRVMERTRSTLEASVSVPLFEHDYIRLDGSRLTAEVTAAPIVYEGQPAAVVFVRETSERKRIQSALRDGEAHRQRLEAQLAHAQKMEAVGQLAGGVAHDFNNMLGVITGHAEIALLEPDMPRLVRESLEEILAAGCKSADLTRQLLAFARRQPVQPKRLDLNETVEGLLKMLRRLIGEGVDLRWQPGQRLWPVKLDPSQVDQVLANLVVNARDAMDGHGALTIETSNVTADAELCARSVEFQSGDDYVRLAVTDTGVGIGEEVLGRVFEPFFTTKAHGRGTGLGLSTVYGIVKQNGGVVVAESEPGKGSTFTIWFPRVPAAGADLEAQSAAADVPGGRELILVVEDADGILSVTRSMLDRLGYTTLGAPSPADALRIAASLPERVDLLITDVIMPGMNGRELANAMAERHPGLRRLFMSGYTADVIAPHGVLDESVHFLQKPFSLRSLGEAVRKALDDAGTATPKRG
jgi:two-component system, cell cycle sensor histidine kinase and response regulator CckA